VRALPGHGLHELARLGVAEQELQLLHVLRERVRAGVLAPQRAHRRRVGPGGAAEPEVDAPRVERVERPELLGDHERRVVGQHDPACADADRVRPLGDEADRHRRRGAGDPREVVVLGQPEAVVAERLGPLRELTRPVERGPCRPALGDVREVEHRQRNR
jgi:hypothetical protein